MMIGLIGLSGPNARSLVLMKQKRRDLLKNEADIVMLLRMNFVVIRILIFMLLNVMYRVVQPQAGVHGVNGHNVLLFVVMENKFVNDFVKRKNVVAQKKNIENAF